MSESNKVREQQYIRRLDLLISDKSGNTFNFSNLQCSFVIKKADSQTPNAAEIKIYNMSDETQNLIRKEFTSLIVQAGYESNYGVIFRGNIKQTKFGKEKGTDTYLYVYAGDGDAAYNFAVVNKTLNSGATYNDQVDAALSPMQAKDVSKGFIPTLKGSALPRGKVMFGVSRQYLQQAARSTDTTWSVQDGKMQFVPMTSYLPNEVVVLNSKSGLVGAPQETNDGLSVRCLLNPLIKVGGRIQLNQADIEKKLGAPQPTNTIAVSTEDDGIYRVLVVEYIGDTRDTDWYCDLICLSVNQSAPVGEQVANL